MRILVRSCPGPSRGIAGGSERVSEPKVGCGARDPAQRDGLASRGDSVRSGC